MCVSNQHNNFSGGLAEYTGGKRSLLVPVDDWNTTPKRFELTFHEASHLFGATGDTNHSMTCIAAYGRVDGTIYNRVTNGNYDVYCTTCAKQIRTYLINNY